MKFDPIFCASRAALPLKGIRREAQTETDVRTTPRRVQLSQVWASQSRPNHQGCRGLGERLPVEKNANFVMGFYFTLGQGGIRVPYPPFLGPS